MSSAKAAARYIERGYTVVPVPAGSKNPGRDGWERLRITVEDVPRYFTNGQNVGIHVGEPSDWRVDVDLDVPEVRRVAGRFLLPTLTSGRASSPDSHWWYVCRGAQYHTFKDMSGETILELRSTGHHTLVWPSVHPSGEQVKWSEGGLEAQEVGAEELARACRELASSGLIARHLPDLRDNRTGTGGGRHDLAMAIAGFMLRRGLSEDAVLKILRAAWDAKGFAGDERARREAHRDLEGLVRDTATRFKEDRPATGGKRLEELRPGLRRKIADYWEWSGRLDDEPAERFNNTDLGNSQRLIAHHGQDLLYCYPWGAWLVYDSGRYAVDESGEIHRRAKQTVKEIYREAASAADDETRKALAKHAVRSESENRIQAMISLAKSETPVMPGELDASPGLLNVLNGTIDLRSGALREHRRGDRLTKLVPVEYDPSASAPIWAATLERVLPSEEVRAFFKRLCGYALSGDVSEHVLPVLYGTGANGKSTILNALLEAAGEYGMQAAPDLLIAKRSGHPTEVADLFGMRLVASIEVEDGRRLAEALVKSLTGGDKVRARRMRQDFWQFDPTHTAFLCTNHKPEIRGTDNAIWRRIRLIPFTETIPPAEQDKKLPEKLRAELPGILAWCVEGCLEWQRGGLQAPDEVRKATGAYRSEMDVIGTFLRDECEVGPDYKASFASVYDRYAEWCAEGGEKSETRRKFNARLKERGLFTDRRSGPGGSYEWHGLRLLKKQSVEFAGKLKQGPENDYNGLVSTSRSGNGQPNFSSSVTSVDEPPEVLSESLPPGSSATVEQLQRIRELTHQGFSERGARIEVLAKDHPLGCECEVCS